LNVTVGKPSFLEPHFLVPNLATWLRPKDEPWFNPIFGRYPEVKIWNARTDDVPLEEMNALLLTGGPDVAAELLKQDIPNPSVLDEDTNSERDRWEFAAIENAVQRRLPIFAICKGMQILNVALGGTLRLDIPGHNLPEQKDHDIQLLRTDHGAAHRFDKVNSSHHQAIDRPGDGCQVEAWCANDDIIEQMRLRDYPFALAVQYHPERGKIYNALFDDFFSRIGTAKGLKR
jgi:putative glutamine amidotransferase